MQYDNNVYYTFIAHAHCEAWVVLHSYFIGNVLCMKRCLNMYSVTVVILFKVCSVL